MEEILGRLLVPDNAVIKAATEQLRVAFKQPEVIPELCRILAGSSSPQIRLYSTVLLRKKFKKPKKWTALKVEDRELIKNGCLTSILVEPEKLVSSGLCELIATLAKHEMETGWPQLQELLMGKMESPEAKDRVLALRLLSVLAETAGAQMKKNLEDWLVLLRKTLQDGEEEVCFLSILTLTHLVSQAGPGEGKVYQQIIPDVIKKIELLAKTNEEHATQALDIFDVLMEQDNGEIVVPHIKPIVELCLILSAEKSLDDPIRIKAVTFLGLLTKLKRKTIVKHKLYIPMIDVIFSIMACDEEDENDCCSSNNNCCGNDDSTVPAARQALDILALSLPSDKYITTLLKHVEPALANPSPFSQRAALQALAVSADGCQDHIREKYLASFLQALGNGMQSEHLMVRNAALYMLGMYSEYVQPEISEYAGDILPVLFKYLDSAFALLAAGHKETSSIIKIFYALVAFSENLEDKLVPHLPELIPRIITALTNTFPVRVQELGINLIGCTANAAQSDIIPYFDVLLPPLETYLTTPHTEETQVLLTQSMFALSMLARFVGTEHFSNDFAEKCIRIGMALVEANDDPDVRKCAYTLFGAVATVVKEKMSVCMEPCVALMIKSLQSTEGLIYELPEESNLPLDMLEEGDDDDDDVQDDFINAPGDDNDDDNIALCMGSPYIGEKEQALNALRDFSVSCGAAFYPYIDQSIEESWVMLEYPDDDVRSVSVTATAAFLYAYQRSGQPEGIRAFNNLMTKFIPKLAENITDDWEHSVVVSSLESFTNLLKDCKQATTAIPGTPEKIMMCITKLMKKECSCQDPNKEEEGLEEGDEVEQDETLLEYAGEVLLNLGKAMTPDTFAPYFSDLLPMLLKMASAKKSTEPERSFAVGAMADCMEPLQDHIQPFVKQVLKALTNASKDEEDDVRNNAIFGLGEMVAWGGEAIFPLYSQILSVISNLLAIEEAPRVIDQIVAAVARFIFIGSAEVPVSELVPVLMNNLPLKEDMAEYDRVFKALNVLYAVGDESIKENIPKILECAMAANFSKEVDKETVLPNVNEMVKRISADFPAEFQSVMAALPPPTATKLASLVA